MEGFLKVQRDKLDPSHDLHPMGSGDPVCRLGAWVDLKAQAQWKNNGELKAGQLAASERYLSSRWNRPRSWVQRFLTEMEEKGRIRREPQEGREPTRITICNYETYQEVGSASMTPRSASRSTNRSASDPQTGPHNSNDNNRYDSGRSTNRSASDPQTGPRIGPKKKNKKEKKNKKGSRRAEDGEYGPLRELADTDPDESSRATQALVAAWVSLQPDRPSSSEISKQGAVAKRLAESHPPRRLALGLYGMERLFPYSEGEPWDLFDFERKLSKAAKAGVESMNGGQAEKEKRELARELNRRRTK